MKTTDLNELKIAIIHEALTVPGGSEKVTYELWKMFPHATIFAPVYLPERFPEFKNAKVITSPWLNRIKYVRTHHKLFIPLYLYAVEQFDLSEYDVVISNSTSAAKGALTRPDALHICYCETPMRWAWMPYLDVRASYSFLRRATAHYMRIWDVASAVRVDRWVANSRTIARRVKKFYDREATVIYPPVDIPETKVEHSHDNYYLALGRLEAQKRVDIIVEAAKKTGVQLKVAGSGADLKRLRQIANGAKNIQFLGFVSDRERAALYARCKAFLFASEEDFGIVPVEAMSYGKPVIAYSHGGGAETVIDGKTGILFDAQTADSLAEAISRFEDTPFDSAAIARHAQTFSTERFHSEMQEYIAAAWQEFQSSLRA